MRLVPLAILLCCVALPTTARAQVAFPAEAAWLPLRCGGAPMSDGFQDQAGAIDERDIVGDAAAPAGLRAADATNLYLRLRLELDPAPGGAVRPFAWGMEFDLDGDRSTYEVLVAVEGIAGAAGTVAVYRNGATTLRGDPADPADQPAAATFPFAMNARVLTAPGSNYGGDADYFLDFAVPWSALTPLGLGRTTPTYVWAGTSSVANGLNGDLACHNGATGVPTLDATASDATTGDPTMDPGGGGGGGGTGRLEGGGGCAAGGSAGSPRAALGLIGLLALRRRRARAARA
jgi:hypothetical protein